MILFQPWVFHVTEANPNTLIVATFFHLNFIQISFQQIILENLLFSN